MYSLVTMHVCMVEKEYRPILMFCSMAMNCLSLCRYISVSSMLRVTHHFQHFACMDVHTPLTYILFSHMFMLHWRHTPENSTSFLPLWPLEAVGESLRIVLAEYHQTVACIYERLLPQRLTCRNSRHLSWIFHQ